MFLCSFSRPDVALLWFLIPLKAIKHLMCDQYRWLTIKIVTALLLLAILGLFLYNMPGRPDIALLWFLIPFKAAKHLICDQYRWLTIKIVTALLLLAILALFLYNMPGYMVKKMLGA
ncbi:putative otoferlin-like [Xyrichtys novacula]|uniref:Otoferlin-like n=1 Tax=Xyrichtys novacula TaxID=13765 RepID=A0AAV1GLE5_XYRNO|nr:putative otoferlin-like [Xyrichtys novacula]